MDQRRLRERGGERLSSLFCCGAAPGTSRGRLAAAGALKLRETKSPHKAGHGGWRQDFFLLFRRRAKGGKELARGNQSNHFQGCSGRHTDGQGCRESTNSRAQSTSSSPANHSRSCQRIHVVHQTKILMPSLFCPLSHHKGILCPIPPLKLW